MNKDKINSLLGFAQKAGKVISGENTIFNYLKKPKIKIYLTLIATDTSRDNKDKYISAFKDRDIIYREYENKLKLGHII